MILIDTAVGSNTLVDAPQLKALGAQLCHLASGDVMFVGNGSDGPVTIGIEVKSVADVLASLINGRLNGADGQFAAMVDAYDVRWIVYYGLTRPNPITGALQVGTTWAQKHNPRQLTLSWSDYGGDEAAGKTSRRRALTYDYLEKFFMSPAFTALDVRVKQCVDVDEVASWIAALYAVWQKPWTEHRCLHTFDQSRRQLIEKPPTIKPPTKKELRVATAAFFVFPGAGYERAWALASVYGQENRGGVREMMNAGPAELAKVKVRDAKGKERRIGDVVARAVEEAIT